MRVLLLMVIALITTPAIAASTPADDLKTYRSYFIKKFPNVAEREFANGIYAIDEKLRANWEEIEDFPPYEVAIANGEEMWNTPFANGKSYASCFGKAGVKNQYPHWDEVKQQVITLEYAINLCREKNGEKPLKYKKGAIADLSSYMAYETRGKIVDIKIPNTPGALAAYEHGKQHFFSRRGQLNFSCAHCHVVNAGMLLRSNRLSMARGQATHFPVYRSKWGAMGTIHRRYAGCNKQVRAKPFKAQSEEYRDLEFFHTHMSNGLPWNGPGTRQ